MIPAIPVGNDVAGLAPVHAGSAARSPRHCRHLCADYRRHADIAAPAARALADITALADTTVPIDFAVSGFAPSRLLCARVSRNPPYAGAGVFRSP